MHGPIHNIILMHAPVGEVRGHAAGGPVGEGAEGEVEAVG